MQSLHKSLLGVWLSFALIILLVGCRPVENSQILGNDTSNVSVNEVSAPGLTTIMIDGEGDDWVNRPLLARDIIGDAEGDFLDIVNVYGFANQNSLYILVELANSNAPFVQVDLEIIADSESYLITWQPTQGEYPRSPFALGSELEGRIDLDDINSPESSIIIKQIRIMAGDQPPSETWRAVDDVSINPQHLVWVDEIDNMEESSVAGQNTATEEVNAEAYPTPQDFLSDETLEERAKYVWLEERGEYADYLYRQFHQNAQQTDWGPDGYLYIADGSGKHIVRIAPDGTMDDLGIWKNHIYMQEFGPNAIVFDQEGNLLFNTGPHLYKRSPDGTIEYLFTANGYIRTLTIDNAGVVYYSLNNRAIYQWDPDGEDIFLTDKHNDPQIDIGPEGQLYISGAGENQLYVLDVNTKEERLVYEGDFGPDGGAYPKVDSDGDIWVRGSPFCYQISPEGEYKPFTVDGKPGEMFRWHLSGDIEFDPEGNLWVTYASGEIVRLTPADPRQPDPDTFTSELVYQSFEASDLAVGSQGEIYASNLYPGDIWEFQPDGSYEIIWQHGDQGRVGLAVDDQGVLYAGTIFGEILKMENGAISHYASGIYTERLIIAGDGNLYAAVGKYWEGEPSQIVRITGVDTYEVVATEIDGVSFGSEPIQIKPAMDYGLYVINQSNGTLYFMDFKGNGYPLIQLANETQFSILASSSVTGKIYFISHLVKGNETVIQRYALYEYEPGGEVKMIAPVVPGDPWDMEVSRDGKWLYIIEVGAVDIIPLDTTQP